MECAAERSTGNGEEQRIMEWEDGLPEDDDLTPLSQILIPLELASAFNIKSEPYRTPVDVDQATQNTLSSLRGSRRPSFMSNALKPFNESNGSRDLTMEEFNDDDLSSSKEIRRTESIEDEDSTLRGENSNTVEDQSARTLKRPRLMWTPQLHKRFVDVVSRLGIKSAVPKTIMQLMNVEGLTRENVASHLQKYRLYQKRMQGISNEGHSPSDQLFASTPALQSLNDSECSSHTNSHLPMPYRPGMVPIPLLGMAHHSGHVAMAAMGYDGMDGHHHQPYEMMRRRNWPGNYNASSVSHPHHFPNFQHHGTSLTSTPCFRRYEAPAQPSV
ncbi:hypothetical protein V2J09_019106 [Rumex salicifolius]